MFNTYLDEMFVDVLYFEEFTCLNTLLREIKQNYQRELNVFIATLLGTTGWIKNSFILHFEISNMI